jgi:hypothetical protein
MRLKSCCCRCWRCWRWLSGAAGWRAPRSSGSASRWSKGELLSDSEAEVRVPPGGRHGALEAVPRSSRLTSSTPSMALRR